jgi:SAM-dependent methyltransferase
VSVLKDESAATYEALNLCCGSDQHRDAWNVDVNPACGPDEIHDLNETPWPWPDNAFERVYITHGLEHLESVEAALRESERILTEGGRLKVTWPVGMNERADPDHGSHQWVWDTPEYYCGKRPWDVDVGLTVIDREVSLHTHFQGRLDDAYTRAIEWYERQHGQGRWLFDLPATSGEFTVVFQA